MLSPFTVVSAFCVKSIEIMMSFQLSYWLSISKEGWLCLPGDPLMDQDLTALYRHGTKGLFPLFKLIFSK